MPRKRFTVVLGLLVGVAGFLRFCDRDRVTNPSVLPNNTTAIVTLGPSNTVTQTHQNTTTQIDYHHGVQVIVENSGKVTVKPKTIGWTFDGGLAYSQRNRLYIGCELAYWRRLGWLVGVNFYPLYPNAFTAVSYRLQWRKVNNFSLYVGLDTDTKTVVGIFWRFGNS